MEVATPHQLYDLFQGILSGVDRGTCDGLRAGLGTFSGGNSVVPFVSKEYYEGFHQSCRRNDSLRTGSHMPSKVIYLWSLKPGESGPEPASQSPRVLHGGRVYLVFTLSLVPLERLCSVFQSRF